MPWKSTRSLPKALACNGELMRFFRLQPGWSQVQLAEVAGCTERLVRKAETERNVNADTIEDLAEAPTGASLVVHPEDLISRPRTIIHRSIEGFAEHERQMAHHAAPVLSEYIQRVAMFSQDFLRVHKPLPGVRLSTSDAWAVGCNGFAVGGPSPSLSPGYRGEELYALATGSFCIALPYFI